MHHEEIKMKRGYTGFLLSEKSRTEILKKFPPKFPKVIAHHITYQFGVSENKIPEQPSAAQVVGYAEAAGLQVLVVTINNSTVRPDGGKYHITLSLDPASRKPKDSNDVLEKQGWQKVSPMDIDVRAKFFPFS